jgi:hypothetical protein
MLNPHYGTPASCNNIIFKAISNMEERRGGGEVMSCYCGV